MIFLSGDVGAVLGALLVIAIIATSIITVLLKLLFKNRVKTYWYFIISLLLTVISFFILLKWPDFFF